jgi:uncharacterized protein with HEPN domain
MSNGIALLPSKRPLTRLRDIVENGNAILAYTRGMNFEDFMGNRLCGMPRNAASQEYPRLPSS